MLVLTLRRKERIIICKKGATEKETEIVVRKIQNNGKVVIGIEAPPGVRIKP